MRKVSFPATAPTVAVQLNPPLTTAVQLPCPGTTAIVVGGTVGFGGAPLTAVMVIVTEVVLDERYFGERAPLAVEGAGKCNVSAALGPTLPLDGWLVAGSEPLPPPPQATSAAAAARKSSANVERIERPPRAGKLRLFEARPYTS